MLLQLESGLSLLNGKYLLSSKLGEGGMASVWAATCTNPSVDNLPDEIVLKVLLPEVRKDPEKRKFFLDEARLSTSLDHPYIVRVFRVEQWNDIDLLVMERVWGLGLDELIEHVHKDKDTTIPYPLALRMTAMIAEALHYANNAMDRHGQRLDVIHRDIKPGNVLFTADGQIKVIDFGIAKASTNQIKTQTGMVKGTIAYMSPEQLRGEKLDIRSDLFSLGIVLYELCTGQRPFYGENFTALMFNILTKPPLDPNTYRNNMPPDLRELILSLLDKNIDNRPKDAKALQHQIEAMIAKDPEEGSPKALTDYFEHLFPELLVERSETTKLLGETDPESLLSDKERDAIAAQAEAVRGSTVGLDALPNDAYILPTGEVVHGVSSIMRPEGDPGAAQPPTQLLASNNTPSPFPLPSSDSLTALDAVGVPATADAIRAQDIPTKDLPREQVAAPPVNRMPYILSALVLLFGGGGAGLFVLLSKPRTTVPPYTKRVAPAKRTPTKRLGITTPRPAPSRPVTPQPAPTRPEVRAPNPIRVAPRRRKRRRRRRRSRRRVVQRRIHKRVAPVARRVVMPQMGETQIQVSPPCIAYFKGKRLGSTRGRVLIKADVTDRYTVTCESKRYMFTKHLQVSVVAGSKLKRPFLLRKGSIRILATHWGNVYLIHRRYGDKKLGVTGSKKYRLYEGRYTLVIRHGTRMGVKKTFMVRIHPERMTTLKVRW